MDFLSPEVVYKNLSLLERVDTVMSATYRRQALALIADPSVSLNWRQALAERLNTANHMLALNTAGGDDSY